MAARSRAAIASLAYSDDGTRILTSAGDGTVALWDARTGLPYAQLKTSVHAPESSFIDDGHGVLIAPEYEEPVFRWNTDIGHAIEFACAIAGRDLTRAEWTEAFGDRSYEPVCAG